MNDAPGGGQTDRARLVVDDDAWLRPSPHLLLARTGYEVSEAELAMRDGLTGLFNRRAFDSRLSEELLRALRYQRPLSLLMIDIDHFKCYNDQHGHPQGDVLLREWSAMLLSCIHSTDFVARYGGEEFAVVLPETSPVHALVAV